ncbi:xanthine dehydrogenase family protein molybdopterin-binding subunit [Shewanella avicenniae]|uniref:Xanthine dehydrogenase family protein molybdopterin-binding subunit n=1 Tax=Shewanella avicenniae TaxID=2814294 RepID=A0ABX7QSC7_9GAMM|nr:molybdopterin cofactor-binding domain-containing protein [Shewanella avicenniae]QSX33605.1 xanthine dehydrogenase family protein molybdopterin-binding subunit [Shewanella avicenniae]
MTSSLNLERRHFLKASAAVGGGLFLGLYLPKLGVAADTPSTPAMAVLSAHVRITAAGVIEIMSVAPEIGQGIKTSLPMVICEELDADWAQVSVLQAPLSAEFGRQSAGGSRSTPAHLDEHRRIGAAARQMLLHAAAEEWQVELAALTTKAGMVYHAASGRQLSYAQLASKAAKQKTPDLAAVSLKDPANFTVIGQFTAGVDNDALVNGRPLFGIDVELPGMLHAVFDKCPVFGGKVAQVDLAPIKAMPSIRHAFVVDSSSVDSGVVIVADSWWQAEKARRQLKVTWDEGPAKQQNSADFDKQAQQLWQQAPTQIAQNVGDVDKAFAAAAKLVEAEYSYPFIAHGQLEPINCTAHWHDGHLTLWAPTQSPASGQRQAAAAIGVDISDVTVNITRMGGGFGRRLFNDYMAEAAIIAKAVGVPVKLLWNRQDDFQHDYYRPGGYHKFKAGLDGNGQLLAFSDHFVSFGKNGRMLLAAGMHAAEFPTGFVPHLQFGQSLIEAQIPTGWLRAPTSNAMGFVFQCMLDEVAHAAGQDPLAFQLALLGRADAAPQGGFSPQRMAAVLTRVAEISDWGKAVPKSHGKGIACYYSHAGYFAEVVQASVNAQGEVTVEKVWAVGDVGEFIVNPSGAMHQVQGSVLEGLSQALYQEVKIDGGAQVSNYHQHKIITMKATPAVEVEFIKSNNPTTGLGEPALPPVIPALCNALFVATGKRVRSLPIKPEMFA